MKRLRTICLVLLVTAPLTAEAAVREFRFDQESSHLEGSIKYALIGTYEARFREFGGVLKLDDRDIENSSVELKVSVDSIRSRYPRLDRIVRSDRLLDTATYPTIDFKSRAIRRLADGYQVDGRVRLHNISKELSFRFFFEGPYRAGDDMYVRARGQWLVNRKDFDIIWSRWLDHGGIVVGDYITVDWEILAFD